MYLMKMRRYQELVFTKLKKVGVFAGKIKLIENVNVKECPSYESSVEHF